MNSKNEQINLTKRPNCDQKAIEQKNDLELIQKRWRYKKKNTQESFERKRRTKTQNQKKNEN